MSLTGIQDDAATTSARIRSHQITVLVGALTLLSLAIRGYTTTHTGSLWRDEALFLFIVRLPSIAAVMRFLHFHESHPPLFYLLMRVWQALFGRSDLAAEMLPVLIGSLLCPLAYLIGARVYSRRTGLIFACLTAVSPTLVIYSAQVRPYSLLPLLALASSYFLWEGLRSGGQRIWAGYILTSVAMLYTHNWAWLMYAGQWLVALVSLALPLDRNRVVRVKELLLSQAVMLALYAPWLPVLLYQSRYAGHSASAAPLYDVMTRLRIALGFLPIGVKVVIPACVLVLLWDRWRNSDELLRTLIFVGAPVCATGAAVILSSRSDVSLPRCVLTIVPCLLLAISEAISRLSRSRFPITGVILGLGIVAWFLHFTLKPAAFIRSNSKAAAAVVAARVMPSDLIVICPEPFASSFNYYYQRDTPQIDYPVEGREGVVPYDHVLERTVDVGALKRVQIRLNAARAAGTRVWFLTPGGFSHVGLDRAAVIADEKGVRSSNWVTAERGRTHQLYRFLTHLFGPPEQIALTRAPGADEEFAVSLFSPQRHTSQDNTE